MKKIILGVAMLAAQLSFAQENKQDKTIDEVTILGRKKIKQERKEFTRHAQSTETLSEEELNRNNSAMIDQTLSTMAGVQVDKRTNFGGQRVVVRGYGNDQKFNNWGTKFYLNGVPLTQADGVTVLEDLDFSLVNNIEVVKGPASTLYGGGIGGTVRFYMRPSTEKGTSISNKLTLGSFNHFQNQIKLESVTDNSSIQFNYNHLESDGYRPNGNSLRNTYSFLGNFKLNSKQTLSVFTSHVNSFEGVSGQIPYSNYYANDDPGNIAYIRKGAGNKFISSRAAVSHQWNIAENLRNNTSIFFSNLDTKRVAAGALENSEIPSYGVRSVFNLNQKFSKDFTANAEFGTEFLISRSLVSNYRFTGSITNPLELQALKSNSYFKTDNQNLSVFAVEKFTYHPWDLSLLLGVSANTLKYDRQDLFVNIPEYGSKNLSFSKKFGTVFTPHIALQKVYKNQIFNLSYSEGYNAPTTATAFVAGTANSVNDNLLPEKAKMWDFSVHGLIAKTRLDYQISLFNIDVSNKLTQLKPDGVNTAWQNTGKQRNKGFEASLGYVYEGSGFIKTIKPFVNYSYYNFKYTDFKTILGGTLNDYSGKQVVGVAKNKYTVGLDFDTDFGLYLINTYNYLGSVYTDFENTNKVKSFGLLNSKIGYKTSFGKWNFDVFLAGNNLTNQTNYTFLFLGNSINDSDVNSNFPGQKTDINPGYYKAWFQYGINLKYSF